MATDPQDSAPLQRTLRQQIGCVGVAPHSGARVALTLHPASDGSGIRFRRADRPGTPAFRASLERVVEDADETVLAAPGGGPRIAGVDHLLAALAACGVTNALVDVTGPEIPAMDGSAQPFVLLIECAGLRDQASVQGRITVERRLAVQDGSGWVALEPADELLLDCRIDARCGRLGVLERTHRFDPARFRAEIAPARHFQHVNDLEALRSAGRAAGASVKNLVLLDDRRPLNPEGLRFEDEPVRHALLDCVGTLQLLGARIRARLVARDASPRLVRRALLELVRSSTQAADARISAAG
jgi:UDP-3-O-[3-hydroxymyristoyl] N-acetylglucosamine deacetylase